MEKNMDMSILQNIGTTMRIHSFSPCSLLTRGKDTGIQGFTGRLTWCSADLSFCHLVGMTLHADLFAAARATRLGGLLVSFLQLPK